MRVSWIATLVATIVALGWSSLPAQIPTLEECSVPNIAFGGAEGTPFQVTDSIMVTTPGTISDAHVAIEVHHAFIGDLIVEIQHAGTSVTLHDQGGLDADALLATYRDGGAIPGSEPFDCNCALRPVGPGQLGDLLTAGANGSWQLSVTDAFPTLDDGVLESWCLRLFATAPPPAPPPVGNLLCSSPGGSGVAQLAWSNPVAYSAIEIRIDGNLVATLPGTASTYQSPPQSIPSIRSLSVSGVTAGGSSPARTCVVAIEDSVDLQQCLTPASAVITDLFPVLSVMPVVANHVIGDVQLRVDITHTYIGDLLLDLTSPLGTTMRLHDGAGFDADNLELIYWEFGGANGSQAYDCNCYQRPSGPGALTDFIGETTAGNWRLRIVDQFLEDVGTLNSWCLRVFANQPVFPVQDLACEPTSMPGSALITWQHPVAHESVEIHVNGQLEAILPGPFPVGTAGSYTTLPLLAPGPLQVCVIPRVGTMAGPQQCCALDLELVAPADLSWEPTTAGDAVMVSWNNPIAYDELLVTVSGTPPVTLPAGSSTFTSGPLPVPGSATVCVQGVVTGFGSSPTRCVDTLLLPPVAIEECSNPLAQLSNLLPPVVDTITVSATDIVLDLEVLVSIQHSFVGDLSIDLENPQGISVRLHDHGGGPANDLLAVYNDSGASPGTVSTTCACPLQPAGSGGGGGTLEDLTQQSAAGHWTLTVADAFPQDEGRLLRWCLRITDACAVPPVTNLTCDVVGPDSVQLDWIAITGLSALEVRRNGLTVAQLAGTTISWLDPSVPPGVHQYRVVASQTGLPCSSPSRACSVALGITDLIYQGEGMGNVNSGQALTAALTASGHTVQLIDTLSTTALAPPQSPVQVLWVLLGTFPDNHSLTDDEGLALAGWLTGDVGLDGVPDGPPRPLYLEGADAWGFDPPTPISPYDGVDASQVSDGDDSLTSLEGLDSQQGLDLSGGAFDAVYTQDQFGSDYTDRLVPATGELGGSAVGSLWQAGPPAPPYVVGLFFQSTVAPVITHSWEFGGYGGDRTALATTYRTALTGPAVPPGGPEFRRGDFDADGQAMINDAIGILSYLFVAGTPAPTCLDAGDTNDSATVEIADVVFLLAYLFTSGPEPRAPGPFLCGLDPTADPLGICTYNACP